MKSKLVWLFFIISSATLIITLVFYLTNGEEEIKIEEKVEGNEIENNTEEENHSVMDTSGYDKAAEMNNEDKWLDTTKIKDYEYKKMFDAGEIVFGTKNHVMIYSESGIIKYKGYIGEDGLEDYEKVGVLFNERGQVVYFGEFDNGQKQGLGEEYYETNKDNFQTGTIKYRGEFEKDQYHGKGILYNEKGMVEYKGDFLRGEPSETQTQDEIKSPF